MLSCNFKEKRRDGDYCTLIPADSVLSFGQTRKRCDGEDNCVIFQVYDRVLSLEHDILMIKNK